MVATPAQSENMQFPIPNALIEPFIRQAVSTAITASLGDGAKLVELAVAAALSEKVSSNGSKSSYSSDNRFIFAEVLAQRKIQEIAKEVINEMAEQMRPKIKAQIEKELMTKHSLIAKTLVDGMIGSLASTWAVHIKMGGE